jgi:hypothetical protein
VAAVPWHECGREPARSAHLDDSNEGAVLFEEKEGVAQVIVLLHERFCREFSMEKQNEDYFTFRL